MTELRWWLSSLAEIKLTAADSGGRMTIVDVTEPPGAEAPLHVHHREDEAFVVLEGRVTLEVGGASVVAGPGDVAFGPRDVPHTFVVSSERARFLLVTEPAGFEGFIRALAEPAPAPDLPPAATAPPDMVPVLQAAADHGLEILGPPGARP